MTVRIIRYEPDIEVVPQAIIWRSLRYFTLIVREGEDDLEAVMNWPSVKRLAST